MVGWSSVADTNIALDISVLARGQTPNRLAADRALIPRMRFAPGPVKLPIANVGRFR
jgi:hypothetical protein